MVGSILVVGVLIHCALLHSVWVLKVAQINVQCSLIQELMFYEFRLDHSITEATKNICGAKGEGAVDYSTITRLFKKFQSCCKNIDNQEMSGSPQTVDCKAVLQTIESNLVSSMQRISGELSSLQYSIVCYFHNLGKSICL